MELMMFLGNDHIESISVNPSKISVPGYLGHLKRKLKEKYQSLLQESEDAVEFLIVDPKATGKTDKETGSTL